MASPSTEVVFFGSPAPSALGAFFISFFGASFFSVLALQPLLALAEQDEAAEQPLHLCLWPWHLCFLPLHDELHELAALHELLLLLHELLQLSPLHLLWWNSRDSSPSFLQQLEATATVQVLHDGAALEHE